MKPLNIPRPTLRKARTLTPAQLNTYHFADRHTKLTPPKK